MATDTSPTPIAAVGVAEVGVAEDRLTRLFARFMTSGYLVYLLLLAPTIIRQNRVVATWWTIVAVIAVFGPPVAMGAAAFHRDLRWTRYAAVVTATGFVAAAALWPLAWNGRLLHSDAWISTIPGLAGLAAALAWPPVRTIALLVAAVVPVQLINHHCRAAGHNGPLIPELLFALSFCLLYVGAALMAMRTGRLLDATRSRARRAAASAAAASARAVQRARFNAMLHDWVMSTLLAAARGTDRDEVRHQAALALTKLDTVGFEEAQGYSPATAAAHFRTAVADIDERLPVTVEQRSGAAGQWFPAEPIQILGAAVSEAVRNSVLHAGEHATRTVHLIFGVSHIAVTVADDGAGFDLAKIPTHRLGLAVSIVDRVRRLPGGAVDVRSRPGSGTAIHLSWEAVGI